MSARETAVSLANSWPAVERRAPMAKPLPWRASAESSSRAALLLADLAALAFVFAVALLARQAVFHWTPNIHWSVWYTMVAWIAFRWSTGIYSPCSAFPPDELRRSFKTSIAAMITHAAILLNMDQDHPVRLFLLLLWPAVLPFTYVLRTIIRSRFARRGYYGVPIVVIGNGISAKRAIREMVSRPELGYNPVAVFATEQPEPGDREEIHGVPVVGRSDDAADYPFEYPVRHAILTIGTGWSDERNHILARDLERRYNHLQIFTNLIGEGNMLAQTRPLGPYLAVETKHTRFSPEKRMMKRALDIAVSLPALIASAPLMLIAGIAIKIADPGPIFFGQFREGRGGRPVKIYKLRSMVQDAERQLARYLSENADARYEYERTLKIRADPRIIAGIGNLIRKSSIDELPQFWNILKGDMSLVGPRVMPTREIDMYSERGRELRRDMLPGLTGFWQVEHRNDSDFAVREIADSFYVANWSVWLDVWIILRTVRVLTSGSGAY